MLRPALKLSAIIVGAITLTTLGIFASDSLRGIDSNLANVMNGPAGCPQGMVRVAAGEQAFCMDTYEASPGETCPHQEPQSGLETQKNTESRECTPVSQAGSLPWSNVSLTQAQQLCAQAGKRLPTPHEWYQAALGTSVEDCALKHSSAQVTGKSNCVSTHAVHDLVGNVWEWTDATVRDGFVDGVLLPDTGYVSSVDNQGIALVTDPEQSEDMYGQDYFWSESVGSFGLLRGGFYGSGDDGGMFAVNAAVETNFMSPGVGFRCVRDI